jgi:hypothetical protein
VLYSADSSGEYLIAFDIGADGKLTNKRNFGKYDGLNGAKESHADGIAVDAEGACMSGFSPGCRCSTSPASRSVDSDVRSGRRTSRSRTEQADALGGTPSCLFSVQMIAKGYTGRAK